MLQLFHLVEKEGNSNCKNVNELGKKIAS